MKKLPRHHLKNHHPALHNKNMAPAPTPSASWTKLVILIPAILLILGAASVYYFKQQQGRNQPAPRPSPTLASLPNLPVNFLGCPLSTALCQPADFYSSHIKDSSFSATLKENTPLLAVFDGGIEGFPLSRPGANGKVEEFIMVTLNNPGIGYNAMYYLKGKAPKKRFVKAGEVVATASGEPISFLGDKSFVLVITRQDAKGGQMEPISPANFK